MTPLNAAQADLDAVEAIVRAAGTSFYRGMRVLPPDRRHAMYAIYAFCRMVDDIADEDGDFAAKLPELAAWRERVAGLYRGQSDGPVTRVLVAAVQRFDLRREDFLAVIDGMQMDAETAIVAPDLATLDLYCDRVAAAVGRLSVRAFGDASPAADQVAHSLGRALQLTNILRDLQEDAERGRLYLPREWLDAAGGAARSARRRCSAPGLPAGLRAASPALAHGHFRAASEAMRRCDAEGDEAGAADGRDLRRHPLAPGASRLVAAARTREPARRGRSCGSRCATVWHERPSSASLRPHPTSTSSAPAWPACPRQSHCSEAGRTVTVLEAGPAAGGRCRSYFDRELGLRIDNGNHLLLSGNRAAFAYLDTIGARSTLAMPAEPMFPFMDLGNGAALGAAAEPRPDPVVGAVAQAPRAGHAMPPTTSPCCGCAARTAMPRSPPRCATTHSTIGCSSRSPSRR